MRVIVTASGPEEATIDGETGSHSPLEGTKPKGHPESQAPSKYTNGAGHGYRTKICPISDGLEAPG